MTEPGGASEVGAIIGYLRLNREDWVRGVRETERDSDRIGRLNPSIRLSTNAGEVIGQLALVSAAERKVGTDANATKPFVVNLWAALAAVAPAALPIAAVAGGALIGLVPVLATVALGVSGISDEMKSGQLEGTKYGADLAALTGEATKLKTIAAGGLLSGLDRGLASSHGLFGTVNQDVGVMSTQLGDIVAGGMPALLRILTELNPLFVTFGSLLTRGATELEHWSENSQGVQHFVAYVQTELPQVMAFLGNVIVLFGHLAQAGAGFGGVLLTEMTLLVRVLNAIPIGVLQAAIPLAVSLYVALKSYQAVNAILLGVNKAIASMSAPFVAAAGSAEASSLAIQAAASDEAAVVARSKAAEATAAAEAAVEIAAAVEGTSSVLAAGATASAEAAIEFAAAMQAEADAAVAASVEIGAAATAAAETVAAEGEAAAVGWSAMLGPLAAVGIGVLLLATAFGSNNDKAQEAARIQNSYADSLRQTTDALAKVNVEATNKNLSDDHALSSLDALVKGNSGLKLSYTDLTLAVNGSDQQFASVRDSLMKVADANKNVIDSSQGYAGRGPVPQYNATGTAALSLLNKVKGLRDGLDAQTKTQIALNEANRQAQILADGGSTAAARMASELGVTTDAYVAAQLAAKKNTDQTNQQAIAFQLANDGGSLLALTLDKLSGKKLNYNQALNAFQTQLTTGGPKGTPGTPGTPGTGNAAAVTSAENRRARAIEAEAIAQTKYNEALAKGNPDTIAAAHLRLARAKDAVTNATNSLNKAEQSGGGTAGTPGTAADTRLRGMSAAAVQNRSDILGLVQAAQQAAEAYGKLTGSGEAGRQKLIQLRTQLINSRVALGENRAEVTKYVDGILTIPAKVPPTKLEVDKAAAEKKITDLTKQLNSIKQGKVPGLTANNKAGLQKIVDLQTQIDRLKGKSVPLDVDLTAAIYKLNTLTQVLKPGGGFTLSGTGKQGLASGGTAARHAATGTTVFGPGTSKSDSVPYWLSVGEEVTQMPYAAGWRPLLKAINSGALGLRMPATSPAKASGRSSGSNRDLPVQVHGDFKQTIMYPEPEPVSRITPRALRMARVPLAGR